MNQQERIRLVQLIHMLDMLKTTNPTMSLQHASAFLHVAIQPGLSVTQLAESSGTRLASASRHVKVLRGYRSDMPALVVSGFGKDDRTKAVLLTEEGRRLVNKLLKSLESLTLEVDVEAERANVLQVLHRDRERIPSDGLNRVAWEPFRSA